MRAPPASLFKYLSLGGPVASDDLLARAGSILSGASVYLSSPLSFNDPYDCIPRTDTRGSEAQRRAYVRRSVQKHLQKIPRYRRRQERRVLEDVLRSTMGRPEADLGSLDAIRDVLRSVGVLSLTEDPAHLLMWGHYAGSHTGICLEFDTGYAPFDRAKPVEYDDERPLFEPFSKMRAAQIAEATIRKATPWSYEREWRVISPGGVGPYAFNPAALKTVIFGAFTTPAVRDRIRQMVEARNPPLALKAVGLDLDRYHLHVTDLAD